MSCKRVEPSSGDIRRFRENHYLKRFYCDVAYGLL